MKQFSPAKKRWFIKFFCFITFLVVSNFAFSQVSVTATAGTVGPTTYTTLQLAFAAVNLGTHQGVITIEITSDTTETGIAVLNAGNVAPAVYTAVTIVPSGGSPRTITGALAAGNPIIRLNGADNVTINGLNSGGNSLTVSNTTVGATTTISLLNDASNNTITNCTVLGSTSTNTTGTISILLGTTTGNDNNTISNCTIAPAGLNLPTIGIYVDGTSAAVSNDNGLLNNNIIQDYFNPAASSAGIFINSDSSGWTISNNKLFQTATRTTTTAALTHRGIDVTATNATTAFTISSNTIGFANASGTGKTIYTGQTTNFYPIQLNTSITITHSIQDNTISGINFTTASNATGGQSFFTGIFVAAGAVNIGTVTGNLIGSTTTTNAIIIETTAVINAARFNGFYISTTNATSTIQNNTVSGISTTGAPTTGYSLVSYFTTGTGGIFNVTNNNVGTASLSNALSTGTAGVTTTGLCNIYGFFNNASGNSINISNNFIRNCNVNGNGAASFLIGIQSAVNTTGTITFNNNLLENLSSIGTGTITCIVNNNNASILNIENNTIRNINIAVNITPLVGIQNAGAVTSQINIRNNKLGDATAGFVTTTNNYTSAITCITNTAGTNTCALTITGNDIRGISHNLLASGANHLYINNGAGTLSQNISTNTFTNLSVNTTGNVTFISNNVALPSSGTQTVSGNSIVTAFNKTAAGGTVILFSTAATSNATATIVNSNNNFSNITVTGATILNGWIQTDAGTTSKTVNSNTFTNWTGSTAAITVMSLNGFGGTSSVSNNTISGISCSGNIIGLSVGTSGNAFTINIDQNTITNLTSTAGNITGLANLNNSIINISNNTITNLTSTTGSVTGMSSTNNSVVNISTNTISTLATSAVGAGFVYGIHHNGGAGTAYIFSNTINTLSTTSTTGSIINALRVAAVSGTTSNVYKNKIYNISSTSSNPTLIGLSFTAGTTLNAYNNLITDIRATAGNNGNNDIIQGVFIGSGPTSSANISYNTILLSGTGGTNFTTSGLVHLNNNTATTGQLFLRNNIIVNKCAPGGGITIGIRRSGVGINNYATASNNNVIYANIPSNNNVIYFDGTNRRQTLDAFKLAVTPRESNSETENVSFLSTDPTSIDFLRPSVVGETFTESTGSNIAGITDDFEGTTRFGNPGYVTTSPAGTAPDVGAYEIAGIKPIGPVVISGALGSINGIYTSLSLAFAAINGGGSQAGANINVRINTDINEGTTTAVLNAGTWTTLTVRPAGNRIVFGATTAGNPLIDLNGADNVTINGANTGGNTLLFNNTTIAATAGTSTIRLINDATLNTITNCLISGSANMPLATDGGVVFISTGIATGNDGNTISNCDITASGINLPSKLIYASGSTGSSALANSLVTITNCNLFDYFLTTGTAGIYAVTGNTNWTITNNRVYQTATRTFTANGTLHGIYFANPTFGVTNTITGNTIGYATNTQTGTLTLDGNTFNGDFNGIFFQGQNVGNTNNINTNIISDISSDSAAGIFNGIINSTSATGSTVNIDSNTIRNIALLTTTGTATAIHAGGGSTVTASSNTINNITRNTAGTLYGIFGSIATTTTANLNTINNLSCTDATNPGTIYGIRQITSSGTKTFNSNIINNLSGTSGTSIYGISNESGNGTSTISLNTINTLSSIGGTTPIVVGINKTAVNVNNIFRNKIYDLSSTASNPAISGIATSGAASTTNISNNIIGDLKAVNANASNPINGINILGGTAVNVYYNSVYLDATGGVTLFGSSAIFADTAVNVDFRNNIFVNNSSVLGAGLATAYRRSSTTLTSYQAASNNNCFFSNTTTIFTDGTNTDTTFANYQTRVATRDSNSISYNPTFISTVSSNISFLLFDFATANAVSNAGSPVAGFTIDFENETRNGTTPDIGADEFTGEPSITSFTRTTPLAPAATPRDLCETGGQTITIIGKNLNVGGAPIVTFDGTLLGTVVTQSPTTLTVTTPASLTGTTFTVTTTFGTTPPSSPGYTVSPIAIGGTVSANQIICPNTRPADITLTGSSGTIVWQRTTDATFATGVTVIAGQTTATLSGLAVPLLTAPKNYIRAVLTSGSCSQEFSPAVIVTTATTWNGTVWSDGVPSSSIGAVIAGGLTVSSPLSACSLVVNTGVTVNVDPLIAVTLENQINVNGSGRINFNDTSSLVQTNSTTPNTGNIYYRRRTSTLQNNFDFVYWGTPVTSQLLGRIWMSSSTGDTFYRYDQTIPNWSQESFLTVMVPGRGYVARSRSNTTGIDADNITSPVFTIPGTWLANFKGVPNNGDINVTVGAVDNLISNPYPSAIDIKAFADDATNSPRITGNFLFWTHNTAISGNAYTASDYAYYNAGLNAGTAAASGGATPDRFVDAGQAFFADGLTAGTVTFKNIHRVSGNNNAFFRTNTSAINITESEPEIIEESHKIWLNLSHTNGLFKQQLLTYAAGASNGFDERLDAKIFDGNPDIDFYSLISSYKFAIQSRQFPFNKNDVVELGYKTTVAGTFTITTDHFDGTFDTQDFYLRDNLTGIVHDIKNNPYSFTTAIGTFENRFQIIYEYSCAQTTMWDGNRWSNGLPSLTKGAVIFADYTATSDLDICMLDIIGSAVATVPAGFDIKVQHAVSVEDTAKLIFENNANLIQISDVSNKGNVTIQRNVDLRRLEYTYWSSPVFNQKLLQFSPQTLENRFATYNETSNTFVNVSSPSTQNFLPATGYSVRAPNNFPDTPSQFNGIFKGVPANGDFSFAGTKNNLGYNLVGNPYPSTIDANLFLQENPSTLYFWTKAALGAPTGENYATFTNLGGTAAIAGGAIPNGTIQIGQGFFCQIPTSKMITFTNRMRTGNNSNQFFRVAPPANATPTIETPVNATPINIEKHRIWFNLTSVAKQFNQIIVGYMTGANTGIDVGIDGSMYSNGATSLYSLIANQAFTIQGRMLPFNASDVVPLGFKTDSNGSFTIAVDHLDGLFAGNQNVFLKDNLTGSIHNIKQSPYAFSSQSGTFNNRFEVVYNSVLGTDDLSIANAISVVKIKQKVVIKSPLEKMSKVLVFDLLGRKLLDLKANSKNEVEIENLSVSQQTLIVKVVLDNGQSVSKKIIY